LRSAAENANNTKATRQDVILFMVKTPALKHLKPGATFDAEMLSLMA
jgi:hypothetical protein